jgi:hypothetical protein
VLSDGPCRQPKILPAGTSGAGVQGGAKCDESWIARWQPELGSPRVGAGGGWEAANRRGCVAVRDPEVDWRQLPRQWQVVKVEERVQDRRATLSLRRQGGLRAAGPDCAEAMPVYDRMPEWTWRHWSVMQYRLDLNCARLRCQCREHGPKAVPVPWTDPESHFRRRLEALVMAAIAALCSLLVAAELLGLPRGQRAAPPSPRRGREDWPGATRRASAGRGSMRRAFSGASMMFR